MKKKPSIKRSLLNGLLVMAGVLVFAYGFQVTKVNFEKTRSAERLTQLQRIIRALAHPNVFQYEQIETFVEAPVWVPCPQGGIDAPEPDKSGPYIVLDPYCSAAGEFIMVQGFKFTPGTKGPINFIPPSGASLQLGNFEVDEEGRFEQRIKLPKRLPVEEAQIVRVIARKNVGAPHFSNVAVATWNKIIETVFLALLATTFGTLLAIPLSFLAARNLMSDVKNPLTSVALMVLGWLIGIALGLLILDWIGQLRDTLTTSITLNIGGLAVSLPMSWGALRWAIPRERMRPTLGTRIGRILAIILAALSIILALFLLAHLMYTLGNTLMVKLGKFGFLGYFIAQFGDMTRMAAPALLALAAGWAAGSLFGNLGLQLSERLRGTTVKIINFGLAAVTGATLFAIIGLFIEWLYQIDDPMKTLWIPSAAGAVVGILITARYRVEQAVPIGYVIYYIVRTILNTTRSIEPLVMVIVFVVWVGIGPFAGALALALHTIAALAKLYSEQVESILPGPIEAVTATGANRLQTIMYAVVPQIIPPYISFTMYRWDINVRMSTIIGFAGGGGIGFLLQQNINLLDYRAASVQMIAIAVVVASMDYISSVLREKFV